MNCTHPDHKDGVSCEDYAVACSKDCTCCLTPETIKSYKFHRIYNEAIQAFSDGKNLRANPYCPGSAEWHWWGNSYIDFAEDYEHGRSDLWI
jgi:hypothetical protein